MSQTGPANGDLTPHSTRSTPQPRLLTPDETRWPLGNYATDDTEGGIEHRVPLSGAWVAPFADGVPVCRFVARKGHEHLSGLWWSATTGGHCGVFAGIAVIPGESAPYAPGVRRIPAHSIRGGRAGCVRSGRCRAPERS